MKKRETAVALLSGAIAIVLSSAPSTAEAQPVWRSRFGTCAAYALGGPNHAYCSSDVGLGVDPRRAQDACQECDAPAADEWADECAPGIPLSQVPTINEARECLFRSGNKRWLHEMTSGQRRALRVVHESWVVSISSRTRDISEHWHLVNGLGGTQGSGSGTILVGKIRGMLADFNNFVSPGFRTPAWDPTKAIPTEWDLSGRDRNRIDFPRPPALAQQLGSIQTIDELGRMMGYYYHAQPFRWIGGYMGSAKTAPLDPIFYGWYAYLDQIIAEWLDTPKGQTWKSAHQTHALLLPNAQMSWFYSRFPFRSDDECPAVGGTNCEDLSTRDRDNPYPVFGD